MDRIDGKDGKNGKLGYSDHGMIEFKTQREAGKRSSRIRTLDLRVQILT